MLILLRKILGNDVGIIIRSAEKKCMLKKFDQ